ASLGDTQGAAALALDLKLLVDLAVNVLVEAGLPQDEVGQVVALARASDVVPAARYPVDHRPFDAAVRGVAGGNAQRQRPRAASRVGANGFEEHLQMGAFEREETTVDGGDFGGAHVVSCDLWRRTRLVGVVLQRSGRLPTHCGLG